MAQIIKPLFHIFLTMERLTTDSQPVQQKYLRKEMDVAEKNENGKLLLKHGTTDEGDFVINIQECVW